jgi:hypothetical protein
MRQVKKRAPGRMRLTRTRDGYVVRCPGCKRTHALRFEKLVVDYLTKE